MNTIPEKRANPYPIDVEDAKKEYAEVLAKADELKEQESLTLRCPNEEHAKRTAFRLRGLFYHLDLGWRYRVRQDETTVIVLDKRYAFEIEETPDVPNTPK